MESYRSRSPRVSFPEGRRGSAAPPSGSKRSTSGGSLWPEPVIATAKCAAGYRDHLFDRHFVRKCGVVVVHGTAVVVVMHDARLTRDRPGVRGIWTAVLKTKCVTRLMINQVMIETVVL